MSEQQKELPAIENNISTVNAAEGLSDAQKKEIGEDLANLILGSSASGNPLDSFPGLTQRLKEKQAELDIMAADSLPAAILTDYVSDVLLPNSNGDLVSIIAKDINHQTIVSNIYERLSLPAEKIVYSLYKNGIVIGEFEQASVRSVASQVAANEQLDGKSEQVAEEAVYVRDPGTVFPNVSILTDTYTVFPILRYEKCIGFIQVKKPQEAFAGFNWEEDTVNYQDVVIHPAMDYCYETFGVPHNSKPLQLRILNEQGTVDIYDVAVGCSMLEDAYTAWKTMSLLNDSVVLTALIKNAQIMLVEVEGGTATKQQIEAAKMKLRSLFEGQISIGRQGIKSYLNPQSKPAYVYSFVSNGVGKITANLIGGEYNPGQLTYLTPFVNQFFAAMRAPKQNYGYTEGAGGLDGGGAVEQYTLRYKSTVARGKRLYASFIKKCINNILISKGLTNIVDQFDVKVYGAYDDSANQEMQAQQTKLGLYESVITFMQVDDAEKQRKLRSVLLKQVITDSQVIEAIDQVLNDTGETHNSDGDEVSISDLGDSQLSDDVSDELLLDTGDSEIPEERTVEVPKEKTESDTSTELPEMTESSAEV